MKIINHFFGDNGFEAVFSRKGNKYAAGWKHKRNNNFTYVRCEFESRNWRNFYNERVSPLTLFSTAIKAFNKLINNHKNVNFK